MKIAKLFKNGQSQAVRLPKECRFGGDRVYIQQAGNCVVLIPFDDSWQLFVESLHEFSEDFMETREQPPLQERKEMFE
ncbi:MAG TPA: type II toxin-antitoxin system VapB family antitoxin [Gammaproteobacteria bacterium]|nr:type II toxin-antitoxin system VapB family antitoxin [Gammaproteobacteria bacterium]